MLLVDSCILLDIITENPQWYLWSLNQVESAATTVAINPIIYTEISVKIEEKEALDEALLVFKRLALTDDICFLAGKAFLQYRRAKGLKTSPLPDFFIGAQAAILEIPLLTRDVNRYKTYFPTVKLICP